LAAAGDWCTDHPRTHGDGNEEIGETSRPRSVGVRGALVGWRNAFGSTARQCPRILLDL